MLQILCLETIDEHGILKTATESRENSLNSIMMSKAESANFANMTVKILMEGSIISALIIITKLVSLEVYYVNSATASWVGLRIVAHSYWST